MALNLEFIAQLTAELVANLGVLAESERVVALNDVRRALHAVSPFKDEPVDFVEWVPAQTLTANDYNPNSVAPPEMKLLARSVEQDGFTQPIVAHEGVIVDGFHRNRVGRENPRIRERTKGYLPVTHLRAERGGAAERMASTIRHNRARGVHGVLPMADIVASMVRLGVADEAISRELGMDADEVLRFKHTIGLPELFRDQQFSKAWE